MFADGPWLALAVALYVMAAVLAVAVYGLKGKSYRFPLTVLGIAIAIHSIAILVRWERLGHGPYVNLFEILSSNIWSLHVVALIAALFIPRIRPALAIVLPILQILVLWMLVAPPIDSDAPVTYDTVWLPVHVWLGKVFLGCILIAVGLGGVVILRRIWSSRAFAAMPGDKALEELSYRFVLVGFLFESLMLIAGALWARDAWGRYWAWDPLETWAFVTWLAVAAYVHARATYRITPPVGAAIVIGVFVLAFSTFFGIPFVSTAPHKGAI